MFIYIRIYKVTRLYALLSEKWFSNISQKPKSRSVCVQPYQCNIILCMDSARLIAFYFILFIFYLFYFICIVGGSGRAQTVNHVFLNSPFCFIWHLLTMLHNSLVIILPYRCVSTREKVLHRLFETHMLGTVSG